MNHLLLGLAANPSLPSDLTDRLIAVTVAVAGTGTDADADADADAEDDLAATLTCRTDLSRAQTLALAARCDDDAARLVHGGGLTAADIDPAIRPRTALALLDAGTGPPEWARRFAEDADAGRRRTLASCPDLPPDVTERLAADPDPDVVVELALFTTPEMATRLAGHPHAEVRRAVAANEATPPAVLAALAMGADAVPAERCLVCDREEIPFVHDPHCPRPDCVLRAGASCDGSHESTVYDTRRAALQNPATPVEALTGFADHPSVLLRRELAARTGLLPQVCARLATDPDPGVRGELAGNASLGEPFIRALAADTGYDVQRRLLHHPHIPLDVLTQLSDLVRVGPTLLPRIATASAAELADLSASPIAAVRLLPAERRDLPPAIRDALAADPDAKVAKAVAPHPGLTDTQLRAMVAAHGVQVVAGVAANPDASPTLLADLARHSPPARKALTAIARRADAPAAALIACLTDKKARRLAAGHPALPPSAMTGLLADDDSHVVEAAASNPSLPVGVMREVVAREEARAAAAAGTG
ncbi:hypothetical protein [Streptomyces sp. MS2.AVA.5]|uniref:Uncharacterized protein n=1 Tax=Streptomyces achmelvichensis TaxID=3134111 RepID=A0ACC6Q6Q1_9ACTN